MNPSRHRQELAAKEHELLNLLNRTATSGRQHERGGSDEGDHSTFSQEKEALFTQAHLTTKILSEVRAALRRLDDGTYGLCEVDGAGIPEARLEALPWARCCCEHQTLLDNLSPEGPIEGE
jgi:DnaK suppressor protein